MTGDGGMTPEDAGCWRAARILADLGELTAQWLEGTIASIPTVIPGCGPDEKTADLIPVLAACNRTCELLTSRGTLTDGTTAATGATMSHGRQDRNGIPAARRRT
jgi:hypothetical protein